MNYAPYIAAAYAIALGFTALLSVQSLLRLRKASRRLRAVDTRRDRRTVDTRRDRRRG